MKWLLMLPILAAPGDLTVLTQTGDSTLTAPQQSSLHTLVAALWPEVTFKTLLEVRCDQPLDSMLCYGAVAKEYPMATVLAMLPAGNVTVYDTAEDHTTADVVVPLPSMWLTAPQRTQLQQAIAAIEPITADLIKGVDYIPPFLRVRYHSTMDLESWAACDQANTCLDVVEVEE